MKSLLILLSTAILLSANCDDSSSVKQVQAENIAGVWHLNKWTMYRRLGFDKKTVWVDNHIDTIFYLNYSLSQDTLITWSDKPKQLFKSKILFLTKDTLVLDGFINNNEVLSYSRREITERY